MGIIDEDGSGKSGCKTEGENVASEADEEWVLENGEESSGLVRMESMLKEFAPSKEEDASTAIQESSAVTPRRGLKRSGLGSSGSLAAFLRRLPSISELVAQVSVKPHDVRAAVLPPVWRALLWRCRRLAA